MLKVGLTGGIGSGKSTAAKVWQALGVPVYDSDTRAKRLMEHDPVLKERISTLFGPNAYAGGRLDRAYLASLVFKDNSLLEKLNSAVHPRVMEDFERWASEQRRAGHPYVIQENAILFDHGFDAAMDRTVTILAPAGERIRRAVLRDGHPEQDVRRRIDNQMTDPERASRADYTITNGEGDLIVPQIERLHAILSGHDK